MIDTLSVFGPPMVLGALRPYFVLRSWYWQPKESIPSCRFMIPGTSVYKANHCVVLNFEF